MQSYQLCQRCVCLSLSITNVVARVVLVVLIIAKCPSAITTRKLWRKIKVYYFKDLETTQHTGGHMGRKRKRAQCRDMGFCFYWGWRWKSKVSPHSLLVSLKCKSRNLKPGKRKKKTSGPNGQLSRSTKISKTKETQWGEAAWLYT